MKLLKKNKKLLLGIIIGLILSGTGVYAATILFQGNQVGFDNTNANLTKTNGDPVETVQEALEAIYRKVPQACTTSPFHLGDYVEFTPTSTSYPVDTVLRGNAAAVTLNPSELSLWRVIKINPDCTVEVVSEYVSTNTVPFLGKEGYQNYVYMLNEIAKQYANTTYTLDPSTASPGAFRNVGYDGQTLKITDTTRLDDQTLGTASGAWYQKAPDMPGVEENLGGGDFKFATDLKIMSEAGVSAAAYKYNTTTFNNYWLASRNYYWSSATYWNYYARYMNNYGVGNYELYYWVGSSFRNSGTEYSVRPIVTLKSGLTPTNGDGSISNHFRWS